MSTTHHEILLGILEESKETLTAEDLKLKLEQVALDHKDQQCDLCLEKLDKTLALLMGFLDKTSLSPYGFLDQAVAIFNPRLRLVTVHDKVGNPGTTNVTTDWPKNFDSLK